MDERICIHASAMLRIFALYTKAFGRSSRNRHRCGFPSGRSNSGEFKIMQEGRGGRSAGRFWRRRRRRSRASETIAQRRHRPLRPLDGMRCDDDLTLTDSLAYFWSPPHYLYRRYCRGRYALPSWPVRYNIGPTFAPLYAQSCRAYPPVSDVQRHSSVSSPII